MHLIWPIRQHIRLINEYRSRNPACTRDPRHASTLHDITRRGGESERQVRVTGDQAAQGTERQGTERQGTERQQLHNSVQHNPMARPGAGANTHPPSPAAAQPRRAAPAL